MKMTDSRNKSGFFKNGTFSLMKQLVSIICGLLLPSLFIRTYGSSANGTIASIAQFIGIGTLLQGGLSAASRVSFYDPISRGDVYGITSTYYASKRAFRRFALVYAGYIIIIGFLLSFTLKSDLDRKEIFVLTCVLGISTIVEYMIGIANELFLFTSRKDYINSLAYTFAQITSTFICIILIISHKSLILVKIVGAIILCLRPILLNIYVRKKIIFQKNKYDKNLKISQKGSALARSIAFYIHTNTDIALISLLLNTSMASVYTVHRYVVGSLSTVITSYFSNVEAVLGQLSIETDTAKIGDKIMWYDWICKMFSSILFSVCMILITPFVRLYTFGINDTDYIQPVFAHLLCISELIFCLGCIYSCTIMAFARIKETQWISIIEALTNIIISILLIKFLGIIGVTIGTIVAMLIQLVFYLNYIRKCICNIEIKKLIKLYIVFFISFIPQVVIGDIINISVDSFISFVIIGFVITCIVCLYVLIINYIFFRENIKKLLFRFIKIK